MAYCLIADIESFSNLWMLVLKLNPISHERFPSFCRSEEFHKGKVDIPETRNTAEGSARRNIGRKHDHEHNK
jgi:hypothetical protein